MVISHRVGVIGCGFDDKDGEVGGDELHENADELVILGDECLVFFVMLGDGNGLGDDAFDGGGFDGTVAQIGDGGVGVVVVMVVLGDSSGIPHSVNNPCVKHAYYTWLGHRGES